MVFRFAFEGTSQSIANIQVEGLWVIEVAFAQKPFVEHEIEPPYHCFSGRIPHLVIAFPRNENYGTGGRIKVGQWDNKALMRMALLGRITPLTLYSGRGAAMVYLNLMSSSRISFVKNPKFF